MSGAKLLSDEVNDEQMDADLAYCLSLQEEDQMNAFYIAQNLQVRFKTAERQVIIMDYYLLTSVRDTI